jgi:pimeloyl-ACP methyl ester carboxylesterase
MAAQSSEGEPEPEPEPPKASIGGAWDRIPGHSLWSSPWDHIPGHSLWSGSLWNVHNAELAKVTAIDLAVLAGHLLLYPTGILPERIPTPPRPADDTATAGSPSQDTSTGTGTSPDTDPDPGPGPGARKSGGRPIVTSADPRTAPGRKTAGSGAKSPIGPHGSVEKDRRVPAPPPAEGRSQPPVLLLHGFVDNRSAFALLRRSLLRHGWTRVQALNYSPLTGDIRTAAAMLGPHIEKVCAESGHARVDIVGHSLGGLVARYYVQCLGGDARVRTLVTMGTPHAGTRAVPALAPHPLARQMRPGSSVLEELAAPVKGCRTRFVSFWSDLDEFMIPVESARLEHPDLSTANIQVRGIGHLTLPVHGSVAAEVRRALAGPGPLRDAIDAA